MPSSIDRAYDRPAPDAVFNQVPPLVEESLYTSDRGLCASVEREAGAIDRTTLEAIGRDLADPGNAELARLANRYPPVWNSFDPQGRRVDRIDFHPAWHALMTGIVAHGLHASPWEATTPGTPAHGHLLRAAA